MDTLTRDVVHAARMLTRNPGFAVAAILSLAIGIGANTSIFSIIDALLLRPLPYQDADRLVILWNRSTGLDITQDWLSTAQYFDIKSGHRGFEQVAIAIGRNYNLTGQGEPERVGTIRVSSNLLPMLGQAAALGRTFQADEDSPGRPATAVLGYGMWLRHFGADSKMIGKPVTLCITAGHCVAPWKPDDHVRKHRRALESPIDEIRDGCADLPAIVGVERMLPDVNPSVRLDRAVRLEQGGVHHRKDGRQCANRPSNRQDYDQALPASSKQNSSRETQVKRKRANHAH
jgi:hypothetical protein